jgi:RNA polymerase sigma-70 factor (ECF subfamily)
MEDSKIIELFEKRDQSAINESKTKYGKLLYRISYSALTNHEDSEECVNDALLAAWNLIPPQKPNNLCAFMGRIVRNISINRWKTKNTKKHGGDCMFVELTECIPARNTVEGEIEEKELSDFIAVWLKSLPDSDCVLFMRRYWFGEPLDIIARDNNTSPNKMAGQMYRLRQKLKQSLEKEGVSI